MDKRILITSNTLVINFFIYPLLAILKLQDFSKPKGESAIEMPF